MPRRYSSPDSSAALPPAAAVLMGDGLFGRKACEVMRPAGLRSGAGQAMAAEWLDATTAPIMLRLT